MNFVLRCCVFSFVAYLSEGKAYSLPYESQGTCTDSSTEYFVEGKQRCCSKCFPGTRLLTPCTESEDTVCGPCQDEQYQDTMNYHHNCFKCSKCAQAKGLQYEKTCSRTSDALCVCKPGWYCDTPKGQSCAWCKRQKKCPAGYGASSAVAARKDVQCAPCPAETFSNESSTNPCQPHTRCDSESRTVLQPGSSTSDTICGPALSTAAPHVATSHEPHVSTVTTNTPSTPAVFSHISIVTSASRLTLNDDYSNYWILLGVPVAVVLLILLTLAVFITCHRKGLVKPEIKETAKASDVTIYAGVTEQQLLLGNSKTDPSTLSSSSASSDSHGSSLTSSTETSQDCLHVEQPAIMNVSMNLSFTATINPTMGTCTIPISPTVQPPEPKVDPYPEPQLSQEEELCVSCQQEDGKEALQSVQESGMTEL